MSREFIEKLKKKFPESLPGKSEGYRHWQYGYEQCAVAKLGSWKKEPSLEAITEIAEKTLKRVKHIYTLKSDGETIQGLGKGDLVIIPGYQITTAHAIGITDRDISVLRVFYSLSWHSTYHMTDKQMERYISFAEEYFKRFGN